MDATLRAVEAAALGLPADERAYLVERLLDSLHGGASGGAAELTLEELEARADDASQGSREWKVVRERLRRMLDP